MEEELIDILERQIINFSSLSQQSPQCGNASEERTARENAH